MTRHRRTAAALALLCAAAPARADSIADEADFRFHHAARLYRQGKVAEALAEFLASNRLVRNRNVIFNIARSFEQLRRYNEAYRFYTEILQDPMPETDRRELDAALSRLRPSLALLRIESDPPGATVSIDRKDLGARGQTPMTLALPPGKALALVELAGYRPAQEVVQVATGRTVVLKPALARIYGTLVAEGEPEAFELRLDTADAAPVLTAKGSVRVLPGRHLVYVAAPGYGEQQLVVDVPADGAATARFRLAQLPPPAGAVVVRANLDGALVRVDGKEAGFTPGVIDNVPVGAHRVEVLAEGREPVVRQVFVRPDERSFVDVRLRYAEARVVAAERQLTRVHDAPASITVVSGDEVRGFGWLTLAEALRFVRGLYVTSDRDYDAIGVRGFSTPGTYNNRVLVLSDGHVTNELSLGQGYVGRDFDADLSDVERIEIVRGPGSVLYGSAAFFAVVNVVHKNPAPGARGALSGWAGSLGENTFAASGSIAQEGFSLWARGAGTDLGGEPIYLQPGATPGSPDLLARNRDGERAGHASLRARAGGLTLSASYNDRRKSIPTAPFDTVFGEGVTQTRDRRGFAELAFTHAFESGLSFDARASYDGLRYQGIWNYQVGPGQDTSQQDWLTGEVRLQLPAALGNRIFFGGEVQDRYRIRISSFTPGTPVFDNAPGNAQGLPSSERIVSGYIGDDIALGRRVQLDAAFRIDDYLDSFGATQGCAAGAACTSGPGNVVVNPRMALIAEPYEAGTTKLLFGTAFRAPGFYERYYSDYGFSQVRAVDLQPERVLTGEVEHTHQLNDETTLLVAGYWSRIDHLIDVQPLPGGLIQYQNGAGIVHSAGVEAEVRWQPAPGALVSLWYAYARARDGGGNKLPNSPEHTGAVRFLYPVVAQVFSISTELAYGSPRLTLTDDRNPARLVGEALTWNVGLSGDYARWGLRYGAFAQNLLDQRVSLPGGAEIPTPGHAVPQVSRTLRLQLGVTF